MELEQVAKIAKLARIRMSEQELIHMGKELNAILQWINQLEKINCDHVDLNNNLEIMTERPDLVKDGNIVEQILSNAKDTAHNMFSVPKVVE